MVPDVFAIFLNFGKSEFFRNLRHVCDGGNGLVVNRAFKLAENRTSERHSKKIPAGCQVQTNNQLRSSKTKGPTHPTAVQFEYQF